MKSPRLTLPLAVLLLAVLAVIFIRIRLLTIPLERDEGEFAYGGQLMLQGIPPYKLFYNMKFPGIYAAYALIMALFGQTPAGIHFGLLLVNLASAGLPLQAGPPFSGWDGWPLLASAYMPFSRQAPSF